MNLFALTSLIMGVVSLALAFFILHHSKTKLHRFWAYFNLSLGVYGVALFLVGTSKIYSEAFFYWKVALFGIANISMFFYLFVNELTKAKNKYITKLVVAHGITFGFLALTTNWLVNTLKFVFDEFYFINAGLAWNILFSIWIIIVIYSFVKLYKFIKTQKGIRKTQANYLFYSMLLGFTSGASTGIVAWAAIIYPAWHVLICVYGALATYAIFRYQLMDIKVAFSRLGIFIFVYAFVLGIPLLFGYKYGMWQAATWSMLVLATAGPFIYLFLQKKAEEHLLKEDLRIQNFLMKASYGMTSIHDLKKLNKFVLDVMIKTLDLDRAQTFVLDKTGLYYELLSSNGDEIRFDEGDDGIKFIRKKTNPVLYDEIKLRAEIDNPDRTLKAAYEMMRQAEFQVVVPIHTDGTLLGFAGLGRRTSNEPYSKGMLNALSVFGNQAALAIENCRYMEAESRRMQEEGFQERVASLDMMASSFAHEIDNPMGIIVGQTDFLEEIFNDAQVSMPEQIKQAAYESFEHIVEASKRVSGMIKAILEYSRMGTGELKPVRVNDAAEGFLHLIGPKIKSEKIQFDVDIAPDLPFVLGDKVQLEEVLMNFSTNAMHAVRNNEDKKLNLRIFQKDGKAIRIEFKDNGYGIPEHLLSDAFLASVTTKGSSEGTGLGLFRVRKIADIHKAEVWAESEGEGKGATMIFDIPVFDGDIQGTIKENHDKPLDGPNAMF